MVSSQQRSGPQWETPLLDALQASASRPHAPFYTPGHKRGQGISPRLTEIFGAQVFRADLSELPELDDLFAPQGAIQKAETLAAAAFGADRTWFLINGSTSGIIACVLATCGEGDKLILPRNVHKSVISALVLSGATPVFVQPDYDPELDIAHCFTPEALAVTLARHPDAKAVLMVSPTYYGVCGDVAQIAQLTHQYKIPLIVDEAHGPHFAFHPDLPLSSVMAGADAVVQSTHKVLSALTQASMVHLQGNRINSYRLSSALQLMQSTSPSYLLLASLDAARYQMATQGRELLEHTLALAARLRSQIDQIPGLQVLHPHRAGKTSGFFALDPTRLTVTVTGLGINGFVADALLHQNLGVTAEFPSLRHLTFILSIGNTEADGDRLLEALQTLAKQRQGQKPSQFNITQAFPLTFRPAPQLLTPRQASFCLSEAVPLEQSVDRISTEMVCPYPPGIPLILPGELITDKAVTYLQQVLEAGGVVSGCADPGLATVRVVAGDD